MAKGRQRTQKWYLKNESEVMRELGLEPQPGSGNGDAKEDGENDHVLAQLKSTDKQSFSVKKLDMEKLEYHAALCHKVPMFIVQFLSDDSRYALVKIEDIPNLAQYIETGTTTVQDNLVADLAQSFQEPEKKRKPKTKRVTSSQSAREAFYAEADEAYQNRKWRR